MSWWSVENYKDNSKVEKIAEMFAAIIPEDCLIRGKYLKENRMSRDEFDFWCRDFCKNDGFNIRKEFEYFMQKHYGDFEDNFDSFMIHYHGSPVTPESSQLAKGWQDVLYLLDKTNNFGIKAHYVLRFMNGQGNRYYNECFAEKALMMAFMFLVVMVIFIVFSQTGLE